jgi:hypothetical protein
VVGGQNKSVCHGRAVPGGPNMLLGSDPKQDYKDKVADVRLGSH